MQSRRDAMKSLAWALGAGVAAGCSIEKIGSRGGSMSNFTVPPMKRIRVGFIGLGERGSAAARRVNILPGIETTALCDLRPEAVAEVREWLTKKWGADVGPMREYSGREDSWKALCDDPEVDVVYICTPAGLHAEEEVYAMRAGKHVLVEVPGAQTIDECWEIVETSEETRRHCFLLENCCYGDNELFAWNLCHLGLLGTLSHAEGGYIHQLVDRHLADHFRNRALKVPGKVVRRYGNTYPTHGLGPICMYMDINRGDVMTDVISVSSGAFAHREYAAAKYPPDAWQNKIRWETGDMNTSIIRTAKRRTIMMQLDMSTVRPYSRLNLVQGTKGCFADYPARVILSDTPGWIDPKKHWWLMEREIKTDAMYKEVFAKYRHPLWKRVGEIAKNGGGHGGMDFVMDLRWVYCLQNGLPLDIDVYDLAAWSSIVPCSAESDRRGGERVEIPDFTRGAWKTAKPIAIGDVDLEKMGFDPSRVNAKDKLNYG